MTLASNAVISVPKRLTELGLRHLFSDIGTSAACPTQGELAKAASSSPASMDRFTQTHLETCSRCAYAYATLRSTHLAITMPDSWDVVIHVSGDVTQSIVNGDPVTFRVSLETNEVEICQGHEDWNRNPLHVRVLLIVDAFADVMSVTILDLPSLIHAVALHVPGADHAIIGEEQNGDFEFVHPLSGMFPKSNAESRALMFASWLETAGLRISFTMDAQSPQRVRALLEESGSVEKGFDYVLPSGLHSDTHINTAKLCRSEAFLSRMANAFDALFRDTTFDTILASGWAMATMARRVALRRSFALTGRPIQVITCEGYGNPVLSADLEHDSRVAILTDIIVTGSLVERLIGVVKRAGGKVCLSGAIARIYDSKCEPPHGTRTLCAIPMAVCHPSDREYSRLKDLEQRVFNPVSGCMTQRAPSARSPSEFLEYDGQAAEFWDYVNKTRAYRHHFKEGDTHYIAFVDTQRLLSDSSIRKELVRKLCNLVLHKSKCPDVLLVPDRARSRFVASLLWSAFGELYPKKSIPLIRAQRMRRNRVNARPLMEWSVATEELRLIRGANVLIVDGAAGRGTTIDQLCHMVTGLDGLQVGAAVLLSRLTDGCEEAFNARLGGGFHALFRLPVRPIVIRGQDANLCPVCRKNAALREVGEASGSDAIRAWSEHFTRHFAREILDESDLAPVAKQLALFSTGDEFLRSCRESVASGVTLHALNAAMTNGMAPLRLPELLNDQIPSRNRAAMVRNLPDAALDWSGRALADDLVMFLKFKIQTNVWRATAEMLARHGSTVWLEHMNNYVQRLQESKVRTADGFWNHIACTAYLTAASNPNCKPQIQQQFEVLSRISIGTPYTEGVQRVLDTVRQEA